MRLDFTRSFETMVGTFMRWDAPVVARLLTAVMFAGVVGGLALSSQRDLGPQRLQVGASRSTPASSDVMRVLRDEHSLVAAMTKAQRQ
jgi:hypothetical protein